MGCSRKKIITTTVKTTTVIRINRSELMERFLHNVDGDISVATVSSSGSMYDMQLLDSTSWLEFYFEQLTSSEHEEQ